MLLLRENEILLAMKKRGFGTGKWNGPGGKVRTGESVPDAAIRECFEETGARPENPQEVAVMKYLFSDKPTWSQQVHIYTATSWTGEIGESEEMRPSWFKRADIPYTHMWPDDAIWLPLVLNGQKLHGSFLFEQERIVEYLIHLYTQTSNPVVV